MNDTLVKNLKKNYNVLWPSLLAVIGFLFVVFLDFVQSWTINSGIVDMSEGFHYLIFFIILIINFVAYWIFFVIQIYIVIKKYYFIERRKLFFIPYFLFFIPYFLFFTQTQFKTSYQAE